MSFFGFDPRGPQDRGHPVQAPGFGSAPDPFASISQNQSLGHDDEEEDAYVIYMLLRCIPSLTMTVSILMIPMTASGTNCKRQTITLMMTPSVAAGPPNPLGRTSTSMEALQRSPMQSMKKHYDSIVNNRHLKPQCRPIAPLSMHQKLLEPDTRHTRIRDISQNCKWMLVYGVQDPKDPRNTMVDNKAAVTRAPHSNGVPAVYPPRR